ncbi:hypothetical protein [Candidatus Rariloculus sp.]|uniref:hypothetical protein n=1 Tax=Candidatus Rariloculus sp. TaxID=3101265 RepID=UPI003D1485CC
MTPSAVQHSARARALREAFAAGAQIGENGHLIASFDYYNVDRVYGLQGREWGQRGWAMITVRAGTVPRRFYAQDVHSTRITTGGIIPSGPLGGTQFFDGEAVASPMGEVHGSVMIGGGNPDLAVRRESLAPQDTRSSFFAHYTHDLGNDRQIFAQALRGYHQVLSNPSPTGFAPAWSTRVFSDNP